MVRRLKIGHGLLPMMISGVTASLILLGGEYRMRLRR